MKENHPSFSRPDNLDSKVWRYVDFTKYVSMLSTSSLFFVRADKLEDRFEGGITKPDSEDLKRQVNNIMEKGGEFLDFISFVGEKFKGAFGISSWHLSEYESAALWKIYLKSTEGVAVQSTFRKLDEAFEGIKDKDIHTGIVKYTNYDTDLIPAEELYGRYMNKRKSYDFEKEVRSLYHSPLDKELISKKILDNYEDDFLKLFIPDKDKGLNIKVVINNLLRFMEKALHENQDVFETIKGNGVNIWVDLTNLIENVIISPYAEEWFYELVKETTAKFTYSFTISQSKLIEQATY